MKIAICLFKLSIEDLSRRGISTLIELKRSSVYIDILGELLRTDMIDYDNLAMEVLTS